MKAIFTFEYKFVDEDGDPITYIFAFHKKRWNMYVEQSGELNFVETDGLEVDEPDAFDWDGFAYMKCVERHGPNPQEDILDDDHDPERGFFEDLSAAFPEL